MKKAVVKSDGAGRRHPLADAGEGALAVVAAALVCWALVALFLHGRMYSARLGSSPWAFALQGAGLAALVAGAVACLAELRRRRTGAGFVPPLGRGLVAASAVGLACLLAGFAWGMDLLCAQGVERPVPSQMDRVPAFGMVCALLPVGACLSLGRRGRVAVYVACAALAAAGTAAYHGAGAPRVREPVGEPKGSIPPWFVLFLAGTLLAVLWCRRRA